MPGSRQWNPSANPRSELCVGPFVRPLSSVPALAWRRRLIRHGRATCVQNPWQSLLSCRCAVCVFAIVSGNWRSGPLRGCRATVFRLRERECSDIIAYQSPSNNRHPTRQKEWRKAGVSRRFPCRFRTDATGSFLWMRSVPCGHACILPTPHAFPSARSLA